MNPDFAQRRRVFIAVAITVIAAPAAFLFNRGDDPNEAGNLPTVTVVGTIAGSGPDDGSGPVPANDSSSADAPSATDSMGTTPVGFLDGTVPARESDPATIAIPRVPRSLNGDASFDHDLRNVAECIAVGAPFSSTITVTNRDNSRSVQCINNIGGVEPATDVVLHADAFLQIADLTDAPIPVQITW